MNKFEELSDEEIANSIMQDLGIIPKEQAKPEMPNVLKFLNKKGTDVTGETPAQPAPKQGTGPYPFLRSRAQNVTRM